jgi:peptidoglycan/LPS O-acetylase OafA/YrhL
MASATPRIALTPARFYLPELDTLRFFAFLSVFLGHAFPGGWLSRTAGFGVDLFFALSAYLISEILLREKESSGCIDVHSFWMRRILRIWPLYFSILAISLILHRSFEIPLVQLALFAVFVGNFASVFAAHAPSAMTGALWSVSIEEQFYLTWPLVIRRIDRRSVTRVAVGLWLLSMVSRAVVIGIGRGPVSLFVALATPCRLDGIAVGLALSSTGIGCKGWMRTVIATLGVTLILVAGVWVFHVGGVFSQVFGLSLVSIGCGCLLLATAGAGILRSRPTEYLGRISYGLYAFHGPALIVGRAVGLVVTYSTAPVAAGLTLAAAATSYRYLELPFLRLKSRYQRVSSRSADTP